MAVGDDFKILVPIKELAEERKFCKQIEEVAPRAEVEAGKIKALGDRSCPIFVHQLELFYNSRLEAARRAKEALRKKEKDEIYDADLAEDIKCIDQSVSNLKARFPTIFSAVIQRTRKYPELERNTAMSKVVGTYTFDVDLSSPENAGLMASLELNPFLEILLDVASDEKRAMYKVDEKDPAYVVRWKSGGGQDRVRVGKVLNRLKLDESLEKMTKKFLTQFDSLKTGKYEITISNDPYDILRKSEMSAFTSCERMSETQHPYWQGIGDDIKENNAIAILRISDANGNIYGKWDARLMLRNCNDYYTGNPMVGMEPRVYPTPRDGKTPAYVAPFKKFVNNILAEKGVLDYIACRTPYSYQGYSDQMGGTGILYYGDKNPSEGLTDRSGFEFYHKLLDRYSGMSYINKYPNKPVSELFDTVPRTVNSTIEEHRERLVRLRPDQREGYLEDITPFIESQLHTKMVGLKDPEYVVWRKARSMLFQDGPFSTYMGLKEKGKKANYYSMMYGKGGEVHYALVALSQDLDHNDLNFKEDTKELYDRMVNFVRCSIEKKEKSVGYPGGYVPIENDCQKDFFKSLFEADWVEDFNNRTTRTEDLYFKLEKIDPEKTVCKHFHLQDGMHIWDALMESHQLLNYDNTVHRKHPYQEGKLAETLKKRYDYYKGKHDYDAILQYCGIEDVPTTAIDVESRTRTEDEVIVINRVQASEWSFLTGAYLKLLDETIAPGWRERPNACFTTGEAEDAVVALYDTYRVEDENTRLSFVDIHNALTTHNKITSCVSNIGNIVVAIRRYKNRADRVADRHGSDFTQSLTENLFNRGILMSRFGWANQYFAYSDIVNYAAEFYAGYRKPDGTMVSKSELESDLNGEGDTFIARSIAHAGMNIDDFVRDVSERLAQNLELYNITPEEYIGAGFSRRNIRINQVEGPENANRRDYQQDYVASAMNLFDEANEDKKNQIVQYINDIQLYLNRVVPPIELDRRNLTFQDADDGLFYLPHCYTRGEVVKAVMQFLLSEDTFDENWIKIHDAEIALALVAGLDTCVDLKDTILEVRAGLQRLVRSHAIMINSYNQITGQEVGDEIPPPTFGNPNAPIDVAVGTSIHLGEQVQCEECGEDVEYQDTHYHEGRRLCNECYEEETLETCVSCGERIPEGEEQEYGRDYYCEDCFNEAFGICQRCENPVPQDELNYCGDEGYCESCYDRVFTTCAGCGACLEREGDDTLYDEGGEAYHQDCYTEVYGYCEGCEHDYLRDDMLIGPDGTMYCENCWNERFFECAECGENFDKEEMVEDTQTGEELCADCADERERRRSVPPITEELQPRIYITRERAHDYESVRNLFNLELEEVAPGWRDREESTIWNLTHCVSNDEVQKAVESLYNRYRVLGGGGEEHLTWHNIVQLLTENPDMERCRIEADDIREIINEAGHNVGVESPYDLNNLYWTGERVDMTHLGSCETQGEEVRWVRNPEIPLPSTHPNRFSENPFLSSSNIRSLLESWRRNLETVVPAIELDHRPPQPHGQEEMCPTEQEALDAALLMLREYQAQGRMLTLSELGRTMRADATTFRCCEIANVLREVAGFYQGTTDAETYLAMTGHDIFESLPEGNGVWDWALDRRDSDGVLVERVAPTPIPRSGYCVQRQGEGDIAFLQRCYEPIIQQVAPNWRQRPPPTDGRNGGRPCITQQEAETALYRLYQIARLRNGNLLNLNGLETEMFAFWNREPNQVPGCNWTFSTAISNVIARIRSEPPPAVVPVQQQPQEGNLCVRFALESDQDFIPRCYRPILEQVAPGWRQRTPEQRNDYHPCITQDEAIDSLYSLYRIARNGDMSMLTYDALRQIYVVWGTLLEFTGCGWGFNYVFDVVRERIQNEPQPQEGNEFPDLHANYIKDEFFDSLDHIDSHWRERITFSEEGRNYPEGCMTDGDAYDAIINMLFQKNSFEEEEALITLEDIVNLLRTDPDLIRCTRPADVLLDVADELSRAIETGLLSERQFHQITGDLSSEEALDNLIVDQEWIRRPGGE